MTESDARVHRLSQERFDALAAMDWSFSEARTTSDVHGLHPYPAKFIPNIPARLIETYTQRGDLVVDPFGGSGTTAVEAVRLGRRAVSIDINPLSALLGRARLSTLDAVTLQDLALVRASVESMSASSWSAETLLARHVDLIPNIPNREKWFSDACTGELAFLRSVVNQVSEPAAHAIAMVALSRAVHSVSFQDSETRYVSRPRHIPRGQALKRFLSALGEVTRRIEAREWHPTPDAATFLTGDAGKQLSTLDAGVADVLVTSPPYGNAYDYHLYLKFRLLWLGFDHLPFARGEIGSHLRHQREKSGFSSYLDDISRVLGVARRALRAGGHAVLVVGDPRYSATTYSMVDALRNTTDNTGLEFIGALERPLAPTRRSMPGMARRMNTEHIVVLRKPDESKTGLLEAPTYRLWSHEQVLRKLEVKSVLGDAATVTSESISVALDPISVQRSKRLALTARIQSPDGWSRGTLQAAVEKDGQSPNGSNGRRFASYGPHGLHSYKGKYYPQLAKALINVVSPDPGALILDPFCGSGTTVVEGLLAGHSAIGIDLNPIAARIASAKAGILSIDPADLDTAIDALLHKIETNGEENVELAFDWYGDLVREEIASWFSPAIVLKLSQVLRSIRGVAPGPLRDFFETVLSSLIREVSHQNPADLRIRRRADPPVDADVMRIFARTLNVQSGRVKSLMRAMGSAPHGIGNARVALGDARTWSGFEQAAVAPRSIDAVVTSPPYAVALPYIDTDRLSLLVLDGLSSKERRPIEQTLTGSREITTRSRQLLEEELSGEVWNSGTSPHPLSVQRYLVQLHDDVRSSDVGFRRRNMPALLSRYFIDMKNVIENAATSLKSGGSFVMVVGDSRMTLPDGERVIPTTDLVADIGVHAGFELVNDIDIEVTRNAPLHNRNAITKNRALFLRRSES